MKEFYPQTAERRLTAASEPGDTLAGPGSPAIVLERSIARRIFLQADGQS